MIQVAALNFKMWHLAYAAYLLWIAGLSAFFLIVAVANEATVRQLGKSCLGKVIGAWVVSALLAAGWAWPLLIIGPFLVVKMGAPAYAGVIMAIYLVHSSFLSGKLLMERQPAC